MPSTLVPGSKRARQSQRRIARRHLRLRVAPPSVWRVPAATIATRNSGSCAGARRRFVSGGVYPCSGVLYPHMDRATWLQTLPVMPESRAPFSRGTMASSTKDLFPRGTPDTAGSLIRSAFHRWIPSAPLLAGAWSLTFGPPLVPWFSRLGPASDMGSQASLPARSDRLPAIHRSEGAACRPSTSAIV